MTETPDLFQLGQSYFAQFIASLPPTAWKPTPSGAAPGHRDALLLQPHDRADLPVPRLIWGKPGGKLQASFCARCWAARDNDELLYFFRLFLPRVIAHEMTHHFATNTASLATACGPRSKSPTKWPWLSPNTASPPPKKPRPANFCNGP